MVVGGFHGFYSGFELLTTKTNVKTRKNHEFSSFPNISSVGFAMNPHNLSLYISSTQLKDAVGPVRALMKTFVFTCFMKASELQVSSRDSVI